MTGVTTIMPLYLRQPGPDTIADVKRAASSVLSQICDLPTELLVIDDGSDPPVTLIPELRPVLASPQARVLRLVQNQGLVYALNAGLTQARFSLIARIDGDDFWRPGKLKRQVELLVSDPDLTLVGTSMRLVHPHNPALDDDALRGGGWEQILALFEQIGCPFPHGSILARKDVFALLGGYPHSPHFTHCEDFALWGSWVRFFKVAALDEVLFEYTISDEQVSTRFAGQQRRASGMVHRMFIDLGNHRCIPRAVATIAARLQLPLLKASKILCIAWMFYDTILADRDLYEAAKVVFPDRSVQLYEDAGGLLSDRFFCLRTGDAVEAFTRHARCVHTPARYEPWISDRELGVNLDQRFHL